MILVDLVLGNYCTRALTMDGIKNILEELEIEGDNGYYPDETSESFSTTTNVGDVVGIAFDIEGNYCQITLNGHVMTHRPLLHYLDYLVSVFC